MPMTLLLLLVCVTYAVGVWRIRHRSEGGRWVFKTSYFLAGMASLYVALASPLEEYADLLLTAHMVQHLLLMLVAAPLLVLAHPLGPLVWSMPRRVRRLIGVTWNQSGFARLIRIVQRPAPAWLAFCGLLVLWHIPAIFRWAQATEARHISMHASLFIASLLFWRVVIARQGPVRFGFAGKALYVLCAALVTGLPGALIAFAPRPLYLLTPVVELPFGLTSLADQQLAGLIMWIPMDLLLFAVALTLFAAALAPADHSVEVNGPNPTVCAVAEGE
jgi:cytochrome c oxidase assembly factor CtaG